MSVEGALIIDLDRTAIGAGRARIVSSRPTGLTRVFIGEPVDDVIKTIPLMFNVCGLAQATAAAQACERALGMHPPAPVQQVRALLVVVEMLREHLLRLATDWRRFVGLDPIAEDTLRIMRFYACAKRALDPHGCAFTIGAAAASQRDAIAPLVEEAKHMIENIVFGEAPADWLGRQTKGDLEDWCSAGVTPAQKLVLSVLRYGWADAGATDVDFLPDMQDVRLANDLFGDRSTRFVSAPTWEGRPRETSVLSRHARHPLMKDVTSAHGCGLLARLVGRLIEIASVPDALSALGQEATALDDPGPTLNPGRGIAHVEAARGRLVHGVDIVERRVRQYAILAPTEWNFHADGGAARGLAAIAGRDGDVKALASLFVSAVDPCVGYEVRVH